jgi:hypothetical protein
MKTTKFALVLVVLVLLATTAAGWKWSASHKTAGFTWDESSAQYYSVD